MKWLAWEKLPDEMRIPEVRPYWEALNAKRHQLVLKRVFDVLVSVVIFALTWWLFVILAVAIKIESSGPVFYRQVRITQYGKEFRIFKFRTMVQNADQIGSSVTTNGDSRITKVGSVIRKFRLDEFSQLLDVFRGTMSFVGTRPEVPKYVKQYSPEMMATLLLPAGVTSSASIQYKDEARLLDDASDADVIYVSKVLPDKMSFNLNDIERFSLQREMKIMFKTVLAVFGKAS